MAGQVKGITIEYDGNTVKLETALKKVKSESYAVDQELKRVNNNLKFDPKNTDLLATKQQLLKNRIEQSKEQLTKFKDIQKQLDDKKVEKTSTEYLKVKRAVAEAEGKVRTFNAQLARMNWSGVTKAGDAVKSVGQQLTRATKYARLFVAGLAGVAVFKGFRRLEALDEIQRQMEALGYNTKDAKKALDAVSNSVQDTRYMLQDMGKVASAALGAGITKDYKLEDYLKKVADLSQLTGMEVEDMGAILNKAYSKGAVDARAMFQLNQHSIPIYKLLQKHLGVSAEKLREMSREGKITFDDLYKATKRYNGLAVKMGAETLPGAIRVLTQQLSVIGADFLAEVYDPIKGGVQDLVKQIKGLIKSGYFKEWGKDIGNAVKYFVVFFQEGETSIDGFSKRTQNIIKVFKPLISTIKTVVDVLAGLPPELQGALVFMTLFGGPLLTGVGNAIGIFGKLGTAIQTAGMNAEAGIAPTSGLIGSLGGLATAAKIAVNPITLLVGWVAAIGIEYKRTEDELHQYTQGIEDWKDANEETFDSIYNSSDMLEIYTGKLEELMGKEKKSASDKRLIKSYVDLLNGSIDNLNLKYDEEKDKLSKGTDKIYDRIEAIKKKALMEAYEEKIKEGDKKLIDLQVEEAKLQEELTQKEQEGTKVKDKFNMAARAQQAEIDKINKKIDDNHAAQQDAIEYTDGLKESMTNLGDMSVETWDKMIAKAEEAGYKIPESYKQQVEMGYAKVPSSLHSLYKKTNSEYAAMVKNAKSYGVKIPKKLKEGINSGKVSPAEAIDKINKLINKRQEKNAKEFTKPAKTGMKQYADEFKKTGDKVKKEASGVAKKGKAGLKVKTSGLGVDFGNGYAGGILSTAKNIADAARNVVLKALAAARHAQKSGSPSKIMRGIGRDYGAGYILGIQDEERAAQMAAGHFVSGAIGAATVPTRSVLSGAAAGSDITNNASNNMSNVFNIYGADDADSVADAIARKLQVQMRTE